MDDNSNNAPYEQEQTTTDFVRRAPGRNRAKRSDIYRLGRATAIDETNLGRFARGEMSMRLAKADRLAAYLGLELAKRSAKS